MNLFGYDLGFDWSDVGKFLGGNDAKTQPNGSNSSWWDNWGDAVKNVGKVAVNTGMNYLNSQNKQDTRNSLYDQMAALTQKDYEQQLAEYNQSQQESAANRAIAQQNANARAAAARQTEANRMVAAAKASKAEQKGYNVAKEMYKPYMDAGLAILPQRTAVTQKALGGLDSLLAKMMEAKQMDALNQDTSFLAGLKK
jgi:hypothetical protein